MNYSDKLLCVSNSQLLSMSLELEEQTNIESIVNTEFSDMCKKFNMNENELVEFIKNPTIHMINNECAIRKMHLNVYL